MLCIFDLDGVLVDSQLAVRLAYIAAGAKWDNENWGKAWYEWTTAEIHTKKVDLYPPLLKQHGVVLPLTRLATSVESGILTAASYEAVEAFFELSGTRMRVFGYSCTREQKALTLRALFTDRKDILYFDDQAQEARSVQQLSGVSCLSIGHAGSLV